jgi:hypothetical protein
MPQHLIPMTGQTHGRLTVQSLLGVAPWGAVWHCTCLCGRTTEAVGSALRLGRTKSCGCIRRSRRTTP